MSTSHGKSCARGLLIFILALSSFLLSAQAATAENLIDDLYYQTSNGKWLISLGAIVITLFSILIAAKWFKFPIHKWMFPFIVLLEMILFICVSFIPWREGLALIGLFILASYFSLRYKERIKGMKRVIK